MQRFVRNGLCGALLLVLASVLGWGCPRALKGKCENSFECDPSEICLLDMSLCVKVVLPAASTIDEPIIPDAGGGNDAGGGTEPSIPEGTTGTETPGTETPACSHACDVGQSRCDANGMIEHCIQSTTDGCRTWGPASACPDQGTCQNDKCSGSSTCQDACLENARRCQDGKQQSCKRQADGCSGWGELLACPSGQTCRGDKCQFDCQNACVDGKKRCQGNAIEKCAKGAQGCLVWQQESTCKSDETCKLNGTNPQCEPDGTADSGGNNNNPPGPDCGMNETEQQVLVIVNQERAKVGAAPLKCNDKLVIAAKSWSKEQCKQGRISHDNFSSRVRATGLPTYGAGENVAAGQRDAASVMRSWMNSSGHRANILKSSFTHIGIGLELCQNRYSHYWTQIFATLR